jgi:hypothetical protein
MLVNLTPKRARWLAWAYGAATGLCAGTALGVTSPWVAGVTRDGCGSRARRFRGLAADLPQANREEPRSEAVMIAIIFATYADLFAASEGSGGDA